MLVHTVFLIFSISMTSSSPPLSNKCFKKSAQELLKHYKNQEWLNLKLMSKFRREKLPKLFKSNCQLEKLRKLLQISKQSNFT
jgi:hypothetical protein